jgi:hypothetical protein
MIANVGKVAIECVCRTCGESFTLHRKRACGSLRQACYKCRPKVDLSHQVCKTCGKVFAGRKKLFCTPECQKEDYKQHHERPTHWSVCWGCGEWFEGKSKRTTYCLACCHENQQNVGKRKTGRACAVCGKRFIPRGNRNAGKCCSRECGFEYQRQEAHRNRVEWPSSHVHYGTCIICNRLFAARRTGRKQRNVCSVECAIERGRRKSRLKATGKEAYSSGVVVCQCGRVTVYETRLKRGMQSCSICSKREARRRNSQTIAYKERKHEYRHSEKGKQIAKAAKKHYGHVKRMAMPGRVERVELDEIVKRDGGRCQLCGRKVRRWEGKWRKDLATLDHIVPLSRDGEHTKQNIQLACAQCNSWKGAKRQGQLRLIG